jgi:hypothetical protein
MFTIHLPQIEASSTIQKPCRRSKPSTIRELFSFNMLRGRNTGSRWVWYMIACGASGLVRALRSTARPVHIRLPEKHYAKEHKSDS